MDAVGIKEAAKILYLADKPDIDTMLYAVRYFSAVAINQLYQKDILVNFTQPDYTTFNLSYAFINFVDLFLDAIIDIPAQPDQTDMLNQKQIAFYQKCRIKVPEPKKASENR